jgi:hypothetical protein
MRSSEFFLVSAVAGGLALAAGVRKRRPRRGRIAVGRCSVSRPARPRAKIAVVSRRRQFGFDFFAGWGCDLSVFCGRRHDVRGGSTRRPQIGARSRGWVGLFRVVEAKGDQNADAAAKRCCLLGRREGFVAGASPAAASGHQQWQSMDPAKWAAGGGIATEATPSLFIREPQNVAATLGPPPAWVVARHWPRP